MTSLDRLKKCARDLAGKVREMERHRKTAASEWTEADKAAARAALTAFEVAKASLIGAALRYDDEATP